jgi:hypothetical protein
MADFFSNLAGHVLGGAPEVRPLLPPRYASWTGIPPAEVVPRPQEPAETPARADAAPFPLPLIDPDGSAAGATLPTFRQMSKTGLASGFPVRPDWTPIAQDRPETADFEQNDVRQGVALPVRPGVDDVWPSTSSEAPALSPTPPASVIQAEADSEITAVPALQPEAGQKRSASSASLPDQPARLDRPLGTKQAEPVEAKSVKGQPDTRLSGVPARADAASFPLPLIDPDGAASDTPLTTSRQMSELGSAFGPPVRSGRQPAAQDRPVTADFEQGDVRPAPASRPTAPASVIQAGADSDMDNAPTGASGDLPSKERATTLRDQAVAQPSGPPPESTLRPASQPEAEQERSAFSAGLTDAPASMGGLLRSIQAEPVEAQSELSSAPHALQPEPVTGPVPQHQATSGDRTVPPPAPTVRVTIGRVVVRAAPAAERHTAQRVELPRPPLSLEAYLRGRQGGAR